MGAEAARSAALKPRTFDGLADHIYAMMRGEIVYTGRKSEINKSKLRKLVGV